MPDDEAKKSTVTREPTLLGVGREATVLGVGAAAASPSIREATVLGVAPPAAPPPAAPPERAASPKREATMLGVAPPASPPAAAPPAKTVDRPPPIPEVTPRTRAARASAPRAEEPSVAPVAAPRSGAWKLVLLLVLAGAGAFAYLHRDAVAAKLAELHLPTP